MLTTVAMEDSVGAMNIRRGQLVGTSNRVPLTTFCFVTTTDRLENEKLKVCQRNCCLCYGIYRVRRNQKTVMANRR